jgi:hypothetical protein
MQGKNCEIASYCLERLAQISKWSPAEDQAASMWTVVYLAHAHQSQAALALHKALLFLRDVLLATGDDDSANNLYVVALEGFTFMDIHLSRAECMLRLGDLALKQGNPSLAVKFWSAARPLFKRSQQARSVAVIASRLTAEDKEDGDRRPQVAQLGETAIQQNTYRVSRAETKA